MNELTLFKETKIMVNGKELQVINKDLHKHLSIMQQAEQMGKASKWASATAYYLIVSKKEYSQDNDFTDTDSMCKVMGIEPKQALKYLRVVPVREELKELEGATELSLNSIDWLGALKKKEQLNDFLKWLKRKHITTLAMSEGKLSELIKEYKEKQKAKEEKEEQEEQEEQEEKAQEEQETDIVEIVFQNVKYRIPMQVLNIYKVEEIEEEEGE